MTPQELVDVAEAVKDRLVDLVTDVLVPDLPAVLGEKVPKVIPRLIVDKDYQAWANKLKSDRHVVEEGTQQIKKVHSFMIYYKGIRDYPNNTVRSMPFRLDFGVDSFYQDEPGTDADNPDFRHNKEIILVAATLWSARPFGVSKVKSVVGFKEQRGLTRMGDIIVRQSMATVIVQLEPAPIPRI